jgi:hypothetical protein
LDRQGSDRLGIFPGYTGPAQELFQDASSLLGWNPFLEHCTVAFYNAPY